MIIGISGDNKSNLDAIAFDFLLALTLSLTDCRNAITEEVWVN